MRREQVLRDVARRVAQQKLFLGQLHRHGPLRLVTPVRRFFGRQRTPRRASDQSTISDISLVSISRSGNAASAHNSVL
jgi:hypothetical protein